MKLFKIKKRVVAGLEASIAKRRFKQGAVRTALSILNGYGRTDADGFFQRGVILDEYTPKPIMNTHTIKVLNRIGLSVTDLDGGYLVTNDPIYTLER